MITNEELRQQVADILKQAGINAVEVATSPVALERAAKTVTGLLPFVLTGFPQTDVVVGRFWDLRHGSHCSWVPKIQKNACSDKSYATY